MAMPQISNFEEVRRDGKVIRASMPVNDMISLGWEPCKIVSIRWTCEGGKVEYSAPDGILATVVPGANFVAAIITDNPSANSRLIILRPDGSIYGTVANAVNIAGHHARGVFRWFEDARQKGVDKFGVIFQTEFLSDFWCDVDARALRLVATGESR